MIQLKDDVQYIETITKQIFNLFLKSGKTQTLPNRRKKI